MWGLNHRDPEKTAEKKPRMTRMTRIRIKIDLICLLFVLFVSFVVFTLHLCPASEPVAGPGSLSHMSSSMLEIDGSMGEGGGQVLRSSLALSLLTGRAFHLRNVRAR